MHADYSLASFPKLQAQFLELSTVKDRHIRNIGLAALIHNATLSYALVNIEERSFYQACINRAKNLLDDPFLKEYFSKKYDHLVQAGLRAGQARPNERFYANVLDPLTMPTINGLIEKALPKYVRCDGELSLYEDVMTTLFYSYVGHGQEGRLLLIFKDLNPRIKEEAWHVLLDTFRNSNKLSVQTMFKVEAQLPKYTSRIIGFVNSLAEEDIRALSIDQIPELRRKKVFKALERRKNVVPA